MRHVVPFTRKTCIKLTKDRQIEDRHNRKCAKSAQRTTVKELKNNKNNCPSVPVPVLSSKVYESLAFPRESKLDNFCYD